MGNTFFSYSIWHITLYAWPGKEWKNKAIKSKRKSHTESVFPPLFSSFQSFSGDVNFFFYSLTLSISEEKNIFFKYFYSLPMWWILLFLQLFAPLSLWEYCTFLPCSSLPSRVFFIIPWICGLVMWLTLANHIWADVIILSSLAMRTACPT